MTVYYEDQIWAGSEYKPQVFGGNVSPGYADDLVYFAPVSAVHTLSAALFEAADTFAASLFSRNHITASLIEGADVFMAILTGGYTPTVVYSGYPVRNVTLKSTSIRVRTLR